MNFIDDCYENIDQKKKEYHKKETSWFIEGVKVYIKDAVLAGMTSTVVTVPDRLPYNDYIDALITFQQEEASQLVIETSAPYQPPRTVRLSWSVPQKQHLPGCGQGGDCCQDGCIYNG